MDPDVLAMERGEHLDLLLVVMNLQRVCFRRRFVSIRYYFAVELLPVVLAQFAAAVERIAEDCNYCFHIHHHHISAAAVAAVVEDDIHRNTHRRHRELMML